MIPLLTAAALLTVTPLDTDDMGSSSGGSLNVGTVAHRVPSRDVDEEVVQMARAFRIQIYALYRNQRSEYDQRFEQGSDLLKQYSRSQQNNHQRDLSTEWYRDAMSIQTQSIDAALPQLPDLGEHSEPQRLPTVSDDHAEEDQAALVDRESQIEAITDEIEYHRTTRPSSRRPYRILETMGRAVMSAMDLETVGSGGEDADSMSGAAPPTAQNLIQNDDGQETVELNSPNSVDE